MVNMGEFNGMEREVLFNMWNGRQPLTSAYIKSEDHCHIN